MTGIYLLELHVHANCTYYSIVINMHGDTAYHHVTY
jgi:hypothetical protein